MKSSHEIINDAAQKFKEAVIFGLHYYLQEKSSSLIRPSLYAYEVNTVLSVFLTKKIILE